MRQRIGVRLLASFGLLLLLMATAGAIGHVAMGRAVGSQLLFVTILRLKRPLTEG